MGTRVTRSANLSIQQGDSATRIQREFRRKRVNKPNPIMVFLLNPYDTTLDLANREDRKLFNEACKGVADDDKFPGKRKDYNDFLKLMERSFEDIRVMEAIEIAKK